MQIGKGKSATIIRVKTEEKMRMRLRMFDIYPGMRVKVVRRSLFSGSILLEINGSLVSVGKEIAERISVMRIGT